MGNLQHSRRGVDGDDLCFRRDAEQRGGGGAGSTPGVEQPQPAALAGDSHALRRYSEVRMVSGVRTDQPVVYGGADVECTGDIGSGQSLRADTHWVVSTESVCCPARWRSQSNKTAVTIAKPNRKSSTGMSNGKRTPLVCWSS